MVIWSMYPSKTWGSSIFVCPLSMNACCFFLSLLLEGLKEETKQLLCSSSKKKGKGGAKNESSKSEETKLDAQPVTIHLNFKRYIYDPHKKMVQSWPSVQSFPIRAEKRTGKTDTTKVWDMERETSCTCFFVCRVSILLFGIFIIPSNME